MKNKITIGLIITLVAAGVTISIQRNKIQKISKERDIYQGNTYGLLTNIEELRKDSASQAYQVQTLNLSLDEYKKIKADDAKTISDLNIKLKQVSHCPTTFRSKCGDKRSNTRYCFCCKRHNT